MKENEVSTADFDRPIYAVPDIPFPPEKARFAALLVMRDAAYRAFDRAMAVPRSAIRWAIGLFHRWVEATGSAGVLSWLGGQVRNASSLIREAGIVPSLFAVLSTPPIPAASASAARCVGRGVVRVAKAAWTGIKSLLGHCGTTGAQIVQALSSKGTRVADAVRAVAKHPMMKPVIHALKSTLALVRPVSRGFVANRLLAALVPALWLRAVIGFLFMPLLVDTELVGNVRDWASTASNQSDTTESDQARETEGDLLTETCGSDIPMPTGDVPSETDESDLAEQDDDTEQDQEQEPFLNRASRRAQQREDRHNQHPRR
jgi:hypothetical protein